MAESDTEKTAGVTRRERIAGVSLLMVIVVMWVASSNLAALSYSSWEPRPFFLTYVSTSLFLVFLIPGAAKRIARFAVGSSSIASSRPGPADHASAVRGGGGFLERSRRFLPWPLCLMFRRESLSLFPAWFLSIYAFNVALTRTSVATATILTSTSSAFTLVISAFAAAARAVGRGRGGRPASGPAGIEIPLLDLTAPEPLPESANGLPAGSSGFGGGGASVEATGAKSRRLGFLRWAVPLCAVGLSIGGVVMVTLRADSGGGKDTVLGCVLSLFSALCYAAYSILLSHKGDTGDAIGDETAEVEAGAGRRVSSGDPESESQRVATPYTVDDGGAFELLGSLGLLATLVTWPLFLIFQSLDVESFSMPPSQGWAVLLGAALLGSVLSDLLYIPAVRWTSPLAATVAMTLAIPFAVLVDVALKRADADPMLLGGASLNMAGFVLAQVHDRIATFV